MYKMYHPHKKRIELDAYDRVDSDEEEGGEEAEEEEEGENEEEEEEEEEEGEESSEAPKVRLSVVQFVAYAARVGSSFAQAKAVTQRPSAPAPSSAKATPKARKVGLYEIKVKPAQLFF